MALTITPIAGADGSIGHRRRVVRIITFDSSYPTGGEPLTPADVGLRVIDTAAPDGAFQSTDGTTGIYVHYNRTNQKLIAYWGNAGTASADPEVTSTTDLSTYAGRMTFTGF